MKKNLVLILSALTIASFASACSNTIHGAGKDIENAGEGVQKNVPSQ